MGLKRQIERQESTSVPWVRLDQGGLEMLEAELRKLGDVSIETRGYEPVSSVAEVIQGQPTRLDQLTMQAPAGESWTGVTVNLGSRRIASVHRKDDSDFTILAFTAVADILRTYSRQNISDVQGLIRAVYYVTWGITLGTAIGSAALPPKTRYAAWATGVVSLVDVIVVLSMIPGGVMAVKKRARVTIPNDRTGWFHKNRDSLIIGTVTCLVAGLIILFLTPLVVTK